MKKLILFCAVAGLGLAAAAPPRLGGSPFAGPLGAQGNYPACSKTVTDRCIQLYERGVSSAANLALNERLGRGSAMAAATPSATPTARGGPYEPLRYDPSATRNWTPRASADDYPPCSRLITDRCIQLHERGVRRGAR
ncbi:MAG TPA: hypothetical protein VF605_18895 [Allosphingosinicella sp.]|jgi:hypothetical protein